MEPVTKTCEFCHKSFVLTKSSSAKVQRFCSKACGSAARRQRNGTSDQHCKYCGKPFHRPRTDHSKAVYCSHSCYAADYRRQRKEHPPKVCEYCGKPFQAACVSRTQKRRFCSWRCHHLAEYVGPKNRYWKGGSTKAYGIGWYAARKEARKRDGYRCRVCGAPERPNRAHAVHHRIPRSSFAPDQLEKANDLSNLVTLCWPCHKKVEVGILPCP